MGGCGSKKAVLDVAISQEDIAVEQKKKTDNDAAEKAAEKAAAEKAAAEAAEAAVVAAKQAVAPPVIQKWARAKAGRTKAAATCPPCAAACKQFVIDASADEFGTCKCGFKKDGHSTRALAKKATKIKKTSDEDQRNKMVQREKTDCAEFKVNMDPSLPFGTCLCGHPRAEHTDEALHPKASCGKGTTKRDSVELRSKMKQQEKTDCPEFKVNMDPSAAFGTCHCGHPRAEHTDEALRPKASCGKGTTKRDSVELRSKMNKASSVVMADCDCFNLNMDPSAAFGTCTCGRPKAEHTDEALASVGTPRSFVTRNSAQVREAMEAKGRDNDCSALETQGGKTDNKFGIGNTVRTAAQEEAGVAAAISANAGGADKAAALNEFNEMMKDAAKDDANTAKMSPRRPSKDLGVASSE